MTHDHKQSGCCGGHNKAPEPQTAKKEKSGCCGTEKEKKPEPEKQKNKEAVVAAIKNKGDNHEPSQPQPRKN